MALSGKGSYIETIVEFIAYWESVNGALSPGELALGTWNIDALRADLAEMRALKYEEVELGTEVGSCRVQREQAKTALRARMVQLRSIIKALHPDSTWAAGLPIVSRMNNGAGAWILEMHAFRTVWEEFPGVMLAGGYALADFVADCAALEALFKARESAGMHLANAIRRREKLMSGIERNLRNFMKAVHAVLPADHPVLQTMPRIDPLPGQTPDAVALSVRFENGRFILSWTPSDDPNLRHYRISAGRIGAKKMRALARVAGETTFETLYGVAEGGAQFRVHVVLETGNESASNLAPIQTPAGVSGGA